MSNEVVNNNMIECPKCKNNVNIANDRCPKCGESLKEIKKVNTKQDDSKPKVHPTVCPVCNSPVKKTDKFCSNCSTPVEEELTTIDAKYGIPVNKNEYNQGLFSNNELKMLREVIGEELTKYPEYKTKTLPNIEIRKNILTFILTIIIVIFNTIYVSFHTNTGLMSAIFLIIITLYFVLLLKKDLKKYIIEQVKLRPDEKINYVIASVLSAAIPKGKYIVSRVLIISLGLLVSLCFFATPHYIYEKVDGGYNLRYYTYGLLKRESTIIIPENYKGENVIGIRGDTFKNVKSLQEIQLPNTIKEIRGGTFEGCTNLKKINLPSTLTKISGSTFKNCKSLEKIEIPSSVTEIGGGAFYNCASLYQINLPDSIEKIGGEAFYNCRNLQEIKLPPKITEIRGSTFEGCYGLDNIIIPNGVTRIGGSAFRNCYNLKDVTIPLSVDEIGSSAFRRTAIQDVCVSQYTNINERAFKETSAKIAYYENNCVYDSSYNSNNIYKYYNFNNNINIPNNNENNSGS